MHIEFFHLFAKREDKEMDHNQLSQPSLFNSCFFFSSPKPRLRWDSDLHDRFVMAVTRLGGPYEAKPTAIKQTMEAMGVHGLTLRHVKSHLQKYRANCKSDEGNEEKEKEVLQEIAGGSNAECHINLNPANTEEKDAESDGHGVNSESANQGTSLQLQEEVEKHLELRTAAHNRYMDSILERAYDKIFAEFLDAEVGIDESKRI